MSSLWITRDKSSRSRIKEISGPSSPAAADIQSHSVERDNETPLRATILSRRCSGR